MSARTYKVCASCATAIENADYSGVFDGFDDDERATIVTNVETMGNVHQTGEHTDGYATCWVCEYVEIDLYIYVTADAVGGES